MENNENTVILTDEDGVETEFEVITALEVDGNEYYVLYPVNEVEEDDAVVLKLTKNEDGEEMLTTIEDDEEFEKVAAAYEEWISEEEFEDEE
ncbi:MAG: DUF1292 domain-containing protein [Caloramator sp.]|nr:DUF1292 domain-containing protein [Caloramator sp.]